MREGPSGSLESGKSVRIPSGRGKELVDQIDVDFETDTPFCRSGGGIKREAPHDVGIRPNDGDIDCGAVTICR